MDNEITRIIELVKEKTGKNVVVTKTDESAVAPAGYASLSRGGTRYFCRVEEPCDDGMKSLIIALLANVSLGEAPVGKADFLKSILLGECNEMTVQKYIRKYGVHDVPCAVFVVYSQDGKVADVMNFLENFRTSPCDCSVVTDDMTCAYIRFQDGANVDGEYKSLTDYACLLAQSIKEELGYDVKIGVGSVVDGFKDCSVSYRQALTALRMGNIFETQAAVST